MSLIDSGQGSREKVGIPKPKALVASPPLAWTLPNPTPLTSMESLISDEGKNDSRYDTMDLILGAATKSRDSNVTEISAINGVIQLEESGLSIMAPNNMKGLEGHEESKMTAHLTSRIKEMVKEIQTARITSVKERVRKNGIDSKAKTKNFLDLATSKDNLFLTQEDESTNMIFSRIEYPTRVINVLSLEMGYKDDSIAWEFLFLETIKFPHVERNPPYRTWVFLEKNKKMLDEDSVIGRRQIYYDSSGETLYCNDSEEEIVDLDTGRCVFSEGVDQLLWEIIQEHGITEEVLDTLSHSIQAPSSEIQDRYNILVKNYEDKRAKVDECAELSLFLEKSLNIALDTFDKLFCRRCLFFDCCVHGYVEDLIIPSEKHPYLRDTKEKKEPCSDHCYLWMKKGNKKKIVDPTALCQNKAASERHDDCSESIRTGEAVSSSNMCVAMQSSRSSESLRCSEWKPIERELYLKGTEMFGNDSCLITRNLLGGLKTCKEVYAYKLRYDVSLNSCSKDNENLNTDSMEQKRQNNDGSFCKRGRARKLKFSKKISGHSTSRKRMADGKALRKHYTPCGCKGICGKQCTCHENETCCEKYCGCSKSCKMRFRGCYCAKNQCRSLQCPCFKANRECDPDVCRNCLVSCGDGESIGPSAREDGLNCNNMQILTKQKQGILLARSDVAGWGAFLRKPVEKNDFLGEYTGELISHREADKRGKVYDLENLSYLFDLNDKFVLDAKRKGNKLKFVNHSAKPNCEAKVMFVAGNHCVGIYAKVDITAGMELFYDYEYTPDLNIPWAHRPKSSKRRYSSTSNRRAKKHFFPSFTELQVSYDTDSDRPDNDKGKAPMDVEQMAQEAEIMETCDMAQTAAGFAEQVMESFA